MENRNISIAKINGYTYEKVMRAKKYLEEIGSNRRNFDFATLVTYYNDIMGTNEMTSGCKCQGPKYYNGIQNYFRYGKLTLINNGLAKEEDFEIKEETPEEFNKVERIQLGTPEAISEASESVSEDKVDNDKVEEKEEPVEKKSKGRPKKVKE